MADLRIRKLSGITESLGQVNVPTGHTFGVDGKLNMKSTGAFQMPSGTNAQRPSNPTTGMTRWNTDQGSLEWYDGTEWANVSRFGGSLGTSIARQGLLLELNSWDSVSYPGTGNTWFDTSGNDNDATFTPSAPTYDSYFGGTFNFDGQRYATVDHSGVRPALGITQEAWIMVNSDYDNEVWIGSQYGNSSGNSYALWRQGYTFYAGVNTTGSFDYSSRNVYWNNSKWYHVAHTYDGTFQRMLLNGYIIHTWATSGNIIYDSSNTQLCICSDFNSGYNGGTGVYNVKGKVATIRIYNRALSQTELLANYEADLPKFEPLQA